MPSSDRDRLKDIEALNDAPDHIWQDDEAVEAFLAERIRTQSVEFWSKLFLEVNFGCHRVDSLADIRDIYLHQGTTEQLQQRWDNGRSISWVRLTDHPVGGNVELAAPAYVRLHNASIKLLQGAPKLGAHTQEILHELGYSDDQISAWLSVEIVKTGLHDAYLPSLT